MAGEHPSQHAVETLAKILVQSGAEDVRLLRRRWLRISLPALLPPRDEPMPDAGAYVEDLVSIAVASARQAEDAAREALAAGSVVRKRMYAVVAVGAIGILTAIAGVTGSRVAVAPTEPA